ncbi:MAG: leucyl aminopeptidase [Pseudomonadota bacterium]|nr:leucyl aminopeptidase [Pseudomonadota bacterium]
MEYSVINRIDAKQPCDYHILGIFNDKKTNHIKTVVDKDINENIVNSIKNAEFKGEIGTHQIFHNAKSRIIVFGLGDKKKYSPSSLTKSIFSIIKKVSEINTKNILLDINNLSLGNDEITIRTIIIGAETALYNFSLKKDENTTSLKKCILLMKKASNKNKYNGFAKAAKSISNGISKAKDLGNTPPNICTPTFLSNEAKKLKKINSSIKVDVIDEGKMKSLKMGSFLSVSKGSKEPGKLVIIKHLPMKNKKPIILVGKGITFDTGGISIKPSSAMDEMKFDMSGAASVIGALQTCAEMKLKTNVIGILACAENMPSGNASRPGDVVTSMSGISIEILNTDAEGRLVLADALTYAKKFKPKYIIDMATLTGACAVALGKYPSGLFANDQKLADLIKKSGDRTGDRVWQLPLYDDYFDELKTNFADIQNIGGRYGGAITAAAFLAKFTDDIKWAHLDIAGTAWEVGKDKGSTGRPVSLLTDFILSNQQN